MEDAITNPTNPTLKEITMWKDLSPVTSECLHSPLSLLPIEMGEGHTS